MAVERVGPMTVYQAGPITAPGTAYPKPRPRRHDREPRIVPAAEVAHATIPDMVLQLRRWPQTACSAGVGVCFLGRFDALYFSLEHLLRCV